MPATEIIAIVMGIVGCVAGVFTSPCVRQPLVELFGYLKEEPDDNLQKLEDQKKILGNLFEIAENGDSEFMESQWRKDALKVLDRIRQCSNAGTCSSFGFFQCLEDYQRRCQIGKHTPKVEKRVTTLRNKLQQQLGIMIVPLEEGEVGKFVTIRPFLVGREGVIQEIMSKYYQAPPRRLVTQIFGVHGAIGAGKTETVAHVCNRILQDRQGRLITFIWVEAASYEDDLQKLQVKIARKLKLELPTDNSARDNAIELKKELLKNKNILKVLDNVRKAFSLEEIGFPTISDSKITIVITSRSLSVCCQMNCDWKIGLKSLSDAAAYELLIKEVGFLRTSSTDEIPSSLTKIEQECGGLPLAIVTVGKYLRKFHGYDLITTTSCLKTESATFSNLKYIEDKVFQDLMLSYEQLKHGSYSFAKECLLYLTMYPRNYAFSAIELMIHWIGEGLFSEVEGIDEKLGKAKETLEELKDASLLESITGENGTEIVRMHPLIWDMVVASEKENHRFFAKRECRLEKIAYEDWFEDAERVSLMKNNLKELPSASMNFHKLLTLILQGNPLDIELGCDFFKSFPNLKILDLSDTRVHLQPKSISCLKHLTVLLLRNCIHLSCLPSLSGLVALMILDISGCHIEELPSLSELVALMILNISGCPITELPSLLGLVKLMVLDTSRCPITKLPSLSELVALTILNVSDCPLEELPVRMNHLTNLVLLNLSRTRVRFFPSRLVAECLNNLQDLLMIECNISWILPPPMQDEGAACIEDVGKLQYLSVLEITFPNFQVYEFYAKSLHFGRLRSFKFCVGGLYKGKLRNNSVVFIKEFPTDQLFLPQNTSELLLKNCGNETPLTWPGTRYLGNLKFLDVSCCKNLKWLFEIVGCLFLDNLEELVITHCPILENVMVRVGRFASVNLPRLRKLTLCELPQLRSTDGCRIWKDSIQEIGIWQCSKLEKFPMRLRIDEEQKFIAPPGLKIRGDKSWLENFAAN